MPVPNTMADLATLASSNSPAGTEIIGNNADNYLRSHAAIIRSMYAVSSSTIASASTTDLASSDGERVTVTGTTTITSFGTGFAGCLREVVFSGALTIVHSANIFLPAATNIVTVANDVFTFRCSASGQWALVAASRPSVGTIGGVSAFMATVLDDANQAAALATLGAVAKAGDTMSASLSIVTTAASSRVNHQSSTGSGFIGQSGGAAQYEIGSFSNEPVLFYVNNGEVARFFTGGQFSIGSSAAPTGKFNVVGGRSFFAANAELFSMGVAYDSTRLAAGQVCYIGASNSATPDLIFSNVAGAQIATITTGGTVQASGIRPGGGFTMTGIVVSNAAPGALAQGVIHFQW